MRHSFLAITFTVLSFVLLGTVSLEHVEAQTSTQIARKLYRDGEEVDRTNLRRDAPAVPYQEPRQPDPIPEVPTPDPVDSEVPTPPSNTYDDVHLAEPVENTYTENEVDELYEQYMRNRNPNPSVAPSPTNEAVGTPDPDVMPEEMHEAAPVQFGPSKLTWIIAGFGLLMAGGIYAYTTFSGRKKPAAVAAQANKELQTLQAQQSQGQPAVVVQVQPQPPAQQPPTTPPPPAKS